jgi:hypothetical protein
MGKEGEEGRRRERKGEEGRGWSECLEGVYGLGSKF